MEIPVQPQVARQEGAREQLITPERVKAFETLNYVGGLLEQEGGAIADKVRTGEKNLTSEEKEILSGYIVFRKGKELVSLRPGEDVHANQLSTDTFPNQFTDPHTGQQFEQEEGVPVDPLIDHIGRLKGRVEDEIKAIQARQTGNLSHDDSDLTTQIELKNQEIARYQSVEQQLIATSTPYKEVKGRDLSHEAVHARTEEEALWLHVDKLNTDTGEVVRIRYTGSPLGDWLTAEKAIEHRREFTPPPLNRSSQEPAQTATEDQLPSVKSPTLRDRLLGLPQALGKAAATASLAATRLGGADPVMIDPNTYAQPPAIERTAEAMVPRPDYFVKMPEATGSNPPVAPRQEQIDEAFHEESPPTTPQTSSTTEIASPPPTPIPTESVPTPATLVPEAPTTPPVEPPAPIESTFAPGDTLNDIARIRVLQAQGITNPTRQQLDAVNDDLRRYLMLVTAGLNGNTIPRPDDIKAGASYLAPSDEFIAKTIELFNANPQDERFALGRAMQTNEEVTNSVNLALQTFKNS